jgi:hypothetical protein
LIDEVDVCARPDVFGRLVSSVVVSPGKGAIIAGPDAIAVLVLSV